MKLLKFSASWCGPCKMLSSTIASIENKPDYLQNMVEVDVDEDPTLATKYQVRGVPTLVLLDDNDNEVKRVVGAIGKQKLLELAL